MRENSSRSGSERHCANAGGIMDRPSRGAGATGIWYIDKRSSPRRRDRQAGRFAIFRLCELLSSIYQMRTTPAVPARAPKRGEPAESPSASAAFSVSRGRTDNCGMPACPARRNGRRWASPRQMRNVALMMVTYRLPICADIRVPATASLTVHAARLPVPTCPTMAASPTGVPRRHGPRAPAPSRPTAPNEWIAKAAPLMAGPGPSRGLAASTPLLRRHGVGGTGAPDLWSPAGEHHAGKDLRPVGDRASPV